MAWGPYRFHLRDLRNGRFVHELISDIREELRIEVTEVKRFGGSKGVVPPAADTGLIDEQGPFTDLVSSMSPVMGTKSHPEL